MLDNIKNLKRRWCVLYEGTFMWFKGRQDSIKSGWLTKMGGGTSTLGRKNWKRRYMCLRMGELSYMPSDDETAPKLGVVDVLSATEISVLVRKCAMTRIKPSHLRRLFFSFLFFFFEEGKKK